ncbi:prolipoprotein diacylglyceryl transferase [Flavobacterium sp. JLP]|uniref:prolipoprotein diacylglyceryl transferase family protein n=1 Tax=unclassified Flavobacterium TaxID=196869 RepID=UPI00188D38ED|nr:MULTISPECIES: prolipoprotein diacylglyceryl transferase family protein [unclassified Flavobacterium]MBF4493095.1 prolipoprotein diacylglyceryl transferase [Flavobacterium sp. MR2016-29]MBF4507367.1 prolipoprotein diacylglyceryl transferase [Flavobacterium sp. JLP]
MTFPFQFEIFEKTFYWHFIFETLAFFVGIRIYYFLRKRTQDSISDTNRLVIMIGAMVGALIGSRFIALLENPSQITHQTFLTLYQNKTVAGGFLGGLFGVELIKKAIGEKSSSGDLYVIPIITALFIGRIGCFSMGMAEPTYGIETNFFTGINLGDGLKRHPIALYEMFFMILLFIFFQSIKNKALLNGDRFKIFMILYFLFRFLIEFLKPYEPLLLNLSSIQWSSILIFVYYWKFLYKEFSFSYK